MSILSSQNIYGSALMRTIIDHVPERWENMATKGDEVTDDSAVAQLANYGVTVEHVAPSQRGGAFGGPTSYENDTQRGTARYYRADAEAPNKTDRSAYAVPDNATGPYNGTSSRNIVADDPGGTTRLSMFAKAAGAADVAAANTAIGENGLTVGNKQAVGLDEGTGGNNSRAAVSFLGGGYNEWVNVGNVKSGTHGVTKTSGGHVFRNSNSPDNIYRRQSLGELMFARTG